MASKLSWIAFAPMTLLAIAIKIIQVFFITADTPTFFGLDNIMLSYAAIGCALVTLLFAVIFCAVDRKIAPVYKIGRNIFAGIFGVFFATSLACDGANRAFRMFSSMNFEVLETIDVLLTVCCAVVFVVLGLNHFVGNGGVKGLAVFYLIPAVWSALRLVICFMDFTTISIKVADVTNLVAYIFLTLFLFNYAMVVALMKGKSPVKSTFIYGMPATVMLIAYGFFSLATAITSDAQFELFDNLQGVQAVLMGLYIFAFVYELTADVKSKDEIEILDDSNESEYEDIDEFEQSINVVNPISDTQRNIPQMSTAYASSDVNDDEDMIFSIDEIEDDDIAPQNTVFSNDQDTDDYVYASAETENDAAGVEEIGEIDTSADKYITKEDSTYDSDDDKDAVEDEWMDHIDQLILEISEDEFN